jgi:hypothetical protein
MTGGTLAWGIAFAALCIITGILIGWPVGHSRGLRHAAEDAADDATAAIVTGWKELPDEDDHPSPPWPPAPPDPPRAGPGKHRHPAGPPKHALPVAGYLPAEPSRWNGTITVPAPVQSPPWGPRPGETDMAWVQRTTAQTRAEIEAAAAEVDRRYGLPEPPTEVLEPTAVLPPPDTRTDTAWTREMAADMDRWIAEHITATDSTLKEITGGSL